MKLISYDCTIREVGFQTNWYFDSSFVQNLYLYYQDTTIIDYFEIGFLNTNQSYLKNNCGIFRNIGQHLNEVNNLFKNIKKTLKISAMYDMDKNVITIPPKQETVIDFIRILVLSSNVNFTTLKEKVEEFRHKGYDVGINYVKAGSNTQEMNEAFAKFSKEMRLSCIYFADSDSTFTVDYVNQTIDTCEKVQIDCAMHLHNQQGNAYILLNETLKRNLKYIDCTMLGLGGKMREGNISQEIYFHLINQPLGQNYIPIRNELINQITRYGG